MGGTANSKAVHRRGAEDAEKGGNGGNGETMRNAEWTAGGSGGRKCLSPEMSVAGPKGSFEGTGTPRGSNGEQGEIGKPKAV